MFGARRQAARSLTKYHPSRGACYTPVSKRESTTSRRPTRVARSRESTTRSEMHFGVYTELQCDPSHESHEQVYAEAMEQIANADRLGYDYYAAIEHPFFERFGISPNPMAFFAAVAQRTSRIRFRTLIHILPMWNPAFLACQIAELDHLTNGRYGFGVGRGHAWLWEKAGVPLDETRGRYEEGLEILLGMLEHPDGFSYE